MSLLALACICTGTNALSTGLVNFLKPCQKGIKMRLFSSKDETSTSMEFLSSQGTSRKKNTRLNMGSNVGFPELKSRRDKKTRSKTDTFDLLRKSSTEALRSEMMNHEILTREQDFEYGFKVKQANVLKQSILKLIELKESERTILNSDQYLAYDDIPIGEKVVYLPKIGYDDDSEKLLFPLALSFGQRGLDYPDSSSYYDEYNGQEFYLRRDHVQNRHQLRSKKVDFLDDALLSEEEIQCVLQISGGRKELRRILMEGALARDHLIRCNVKLVVSIAKRWARNSARGSNAEGLSTIYAGSSNRPSLDEAIQDGIVGLAQAADRFDASREYRFSTYATYWITNYVRSCFQQASTGCLKVPAPYHDIKSRYRKIVKRCLESNSPLPSEEKLAMQVGVSLNRLRKALHFTRPLVSLDEPLHAGMGAARGSSAGGDGVGERQLLVSDFIESDERNPDVQVELSLLRQCLENAMAAELSPHERDVIRLRLGLDDGVARSAREVVDVCGGCVSIAEVRNAEKRAYRKMASPFSIHSRQLLSYLDFAGGDLDTIKE
jgi:RNA polymerase primary sigma factor